MTIKFSLLKDIDIFHHLLIADGFAQYLGLYQILDRSEHDYNCVLFIYPSS